jgi:histidyl-tRNA synthetase
MSKKFQAMRGTRDILPGEVEKWQTVEKVAAMISERYGYREIRTPHFEATDLFARGVGETTDVVQKEMYTFPDRKGRSLTLRPEGTAGVVRAVIEAGLAKPDRLHKLWYWGPMFRYDRPQAGRYRQFYQWGAEVIGTANPWADVEIIVLLAEYLEELGLTDLVIKLNSVGDATCRPIYQKKVREALASRRDELCPDCRERLEKNPLRVLDCKVPGCREIVKGVPSVLDSLCEDCREHLDEVKKGLDASGLTYEMDPGLVRGLDYYTRTAFEIHHGKLGAQSAVGGGGRYDGLFKILGGPEVPAVGFSMGVERVLIALQEEGRDVFHQTPLVYLARGANLSDEAFRLARELRRRFAIQLEYAEKSLGAQLRQADRLGATAVLILGEDEMAAGEITVKDLKSGDQRRMPRADLQDELARLLSEPAASRSHT